MSRVKTIALKSLFCLIAISTVSAGATASAQLRSLKNSTPPQQGKAESMGELQEILAYGTDGPWTMSASKGCYIIESESNEGDIKYFWIDTDASAWGKRRCSVLCDVRGNGYGGLIYGFNKETNEYYLFVVDAKKVLHVFQRSQDGFSETMSTTLDFEGSNCVLALIEKGNSVQILVNGDSLMELESRGTGRGGLGIAVVNGGRYGFSEFELTVE